MVSKRIPEHFNEIFPDFSTEEKCVKIGDWDEKRKVCWMTKTDEAGWTAPIKGAYFWYSINSGYEGSGDKQWIYNEKAKNEVESVAGDIAQAMREHLESSYNSDVLHKLDERVMINEIYKSMQELGIEWNEVQADILRLLREDVAMPDSARAEIIEGVLKAQMMKKIENGELDVYFSKTNGCMVADSGVYPTFAGMCPPIYEGDSDLSNREASEIAKHGRDEVAEIVTDINRGKAEFWGGLGYCNPFGEQVQHDDPFAVVSDDCDSVKRLYDDIIKQIKKESE